MQKIFKQHLGGPKEIAQKEAKFTWEKEEEAWYFCIILRNVFQVRFTGEHWLSGNTWRRQKIYQYEYIASSHTDFQSQFLKKICFGPEQYFYTSKNEAIMRGLRHIGKTKEKAPEAYKKDKARLLAYQVMKL